MPRIAVVVVSYNSAVPLKGLLPTLRDGLVGLDWTLTVVDNDSADNSAELAEAAFPDCRVLRMGRNAGYAAAINAGLAGADPFDAALVLNPDIRLQNGVGLRLYAALVRSSASPSSASRSSASLSSASRQPGDRSAGGRPADDRLAGITVPRIVDAGGRLSWSLRRRPTIARALGEALAGQRAGRVPAFGETVLDAEAYRRETRSDWATGAIMMIGADCLTACGPWDESFFLYSEETEFALRAADHGWATELVPSAEVTHLGGESRVSPRLWSLLTLNRVRLYRQRHSAVAAAGYWSAVALREGLRAALGQERSRQALRALTRPSTLELGRTERRAATGGRAPTNR